MLQANWLAFGVVVRPIPELAAYAKRRKKSEKVEVPRSLTV